MMADLSDACILQTSYPRSDNSPFPVPLPPRKKANHKPKPYLPPGGGMIIASFVVAIITGGTYLTKGFVAALLPPAVLLAFYFRNLIAAFLKSKETHTVALKV